MPPNGPGAQLPGKGRHPRLAGAPLFGARGYQRSIAARLLTVSCSALFGGAVHTEEEQHEVLRRNEEEPKKAQDNEGCCPSDYAYGRCEMEENERCAEGTANPLANRGCRASGGAKEERHEVGQV